MSPVRRRVSLLFFLCMCFAVVPNLLLAPFYMQTGIELKGKIGLHETIAQRYWRLAMEKLAARPEPVRCVLTEKERVDYPNCMEKIEWLNSTWKSDTCFGDYGVNGSDCSLLIYMSEVKLWCPVMPWRKQMNAPDPYNKDVRPQYSVAGLLGLMRGPQYKWLRQRITRMWPGWVRAMKSFQAKIKMDRNRKKKILIHMGLLKEHFGESAFTGGPLGELVQWSDITACLYILGHDVTVNFNENEVVSYFKTANNTCDDMLIFTDIHGLEGMEELGLHKNHSCAFRIVDSFGTEPGFNFAKFADSRGYKSIWGKHNLWPKQFYNMFPHTPDNTFLGFVVERRWNMTALRTAKKKNQGVVYGKRSAMWKGRQAYLDTISKFVELHGTVTSQIQDDDNLNYIPSYIRNHGILPGDKLMELLQESKLFIGLGFPYEGPAPLEAIANGAIFINPKFDTPVSRKTSDFFKKKPTFRELPNQFPYAQDFIGEPHVLTVDMKNLTDVEMKIKRALASLEDVKPYLPHEFTEEGTLERIHTLIQYQDFCDPSAERWPPKSAITFHLGTPGKSCEAVCHEKGLICEPTYLKDVNSQKSFQEHGIHCATNRTVSDLTYPAVNTKTKECTFQFQPLLYSCVGSSLGLSRMCSCRNFIKGQTALCEECLGWSKKGS